jgi:hypothetical protein
VVLWLHSGGVANLWAVEWKSDERVGTFIGAGLEGEDGEFGHVLVEAEGEHAADGAIAYDDVVCVPFGYFDGIEAGESEGD